MAANLTTQRMSLPHGKPTITRSVPTPTSRVLIDGAVDTMVAFAFQDGHISRIFAVSNPDKLHRLTHTTALSR